MKYQMLFSGQNKKNIMNLLSAEFANTVVKVKHPNTYLPIHGFYVDQS